MGASSVRPVLWCFLVGLGVACSGTSSPEGEETGGRGGAEDSSAGGHAGDPQSPPGGQGGGDDDVAVGGAAGGGGVDGDGEGGAGGMTSGGAGGSSAGGAGGGQGGMAGATGGTAGTTPPVEMNKPPKYTQDFEGVATGKTPGSPFSNPKSAAVDETRAFSGKKSLKVTNGNISFANRMVVPSGKSYYVRFMLWMDSSPLTNHFSHYDMIVFHGSFSGNGQTMNGFYSFGGFNNGGGSQKVQIYGNVAGKTADCAKSAPLALMPKKWHCVELKVDDKDILNYGTFIDGKELQNFSFPYDFAGANCVPGQNPTNGKWYVPSVNNITFGYRGIFQQAGAMTLYFDDIAFSDSPIGCPKM